MTDREQPEQPQQPEAPEPDRSAGEETPTWLPVSFTLIGSLLAVTAVWLWMAGQPRPQTQPSQAGPIQEQARVSSARPDIAHPATSTPLPAETPAMASASKEPEDARPKPDPPPGTLVGSPASPGDLREATPAAPTASPAAIDSPSKREDCPPAIAIPFEHGGALPVIAGDTEKRLARLREWLERHPGDKLIVEGHTDTGGSERYNLLLSYRRAKTIVGFLNRAGVPERQITILAAGESSPIEDMPADSKANRRVILQVKGIESCRDAPTKGEEL